MPTNFDNQLDQALDFSNANIDPYGRSYDALLGIAKSVERNLNKGLAGEPIKVELEPGFLANMGQQLRVNVRIPDKQFRDTLFRAYIPTDGLPIFLDLYGEEPIPCDTLADLERKILDFLVRIKDRMASYRKYASP